MRKFLLLLSMVSLSATAQWSAYTEKDELRKSQTVGVDTTVSPVSGDGPKLYVNIMTPPDHPDWRFAIVKFSDDMEKIQCESICQITMRLDDYKVVEDSFTMVNGEFIRPLYSNALVKAMNIAETMYIEIPTASGRAYQYRLDLKEFDVKVDMKPQVSMGGVTIGDDQSSIPSNFEKMKNPDCFSANNVALTQGGVVAPSATTCVTKGKISSISFYDIPEKDRAKVNGYFLKQFGSVDKSSAKYHMLSWPLEKSLGHFHTVDGTSILGRYMIYDSSNRYLTKQTN